MSIHQVLVTAAAHDAVTNHAIGLRAGLEQWGASHVYAVHVDPALGSTVRPLQEFPTAGVDAIVFHGSIGAPEVSGFLLRRPEPIVLVYHNITPPEFFAPYDPEFAALLAAGRTDLEVLRHRVVLALADSDYNAAELRAMGYEDVRVAPLAVDLDRLELPEQATDAPSAPSPWPEGDGPVFLSVGQVLPHKRIDLLVGAFHIVSTYLDPGARLLLVGSTDFVPYVRAVRQFVAELALPGVWMPGKVSDEVLAAAFRSADVFVTASEHEGFCIPILEAMACGLPVVGRAHASVPDTAGDAAVVLPPDSGAELLAEAMMALVTERQWTAELVGRARRRADSFRTLDAVGTAAGFIDRVVA